MMEEQPKINLKNLRRYITQEHIDTTIKNIFVRDRELRMVFLLIFNIQPSTIAELTDNFFNEFGEGIIRNTLRTKLTKIENFALINSKTFPECSVVGGKIDIQIIKKHNEWKATTPAVCPAHHDNKIHYFFLTKEGEEWVKEVEKIHTCQLDNDKKFFANKSSE
jgi:hypothetical protein